MVTCCFRRELDKAKVGEGSETIAWLSGKNAPGRKGTEGIQSLR